jgi:ATP-dependent Lon protease
MAIAVASLLLGRPVRPDVAVTGELTLRGQILPVSGVKAQLLAAHRSGIREVILPARNARDLEDVPEEIRTDLVVHLVSHIDRALELMLSPPVPTPPEARAPTSEHAPGQAHP